MTQTSRAAFLVLLAVSNVAAQPDQVTAAITYATLPLEERSQILGLPWNGEHDRKTLTFGNAAGALVVVGIDDHRLWVRRSVNGGASFGSETRPDATTEGIHDLLGVLASDGKLYLAYLAGLSTGGVGLRLLRSDDMGASWSAPTSVFQDGTAGFPVTAASLTAGGPGQVAVVVAGDGGTHPYARVSADSGGTWTAPVRLDPGAGAVPSPPRRLDVVIDGSGIIHAAWIQQRTALPRIFLARSTNGGATFLPEVELASQFTGEAFDLDLERAQAGYAMLAGSFRQAPDSFGTAIEARRTDDGGASWVPTLVHTSTNDGTWHPRFAVHPDTPSMYLHATDPDSNLLLWKSGDGFNWLATADVISTTAAGNDEPSRPMGETQMVRTGPMTWVIAWTDKRTDSYAGRLTDIWARATQTEVAFGPETRVVTAPPGEPTGAWLTGMAAYGGATPGVHVVWSDGRNFDDRSDDSYSDRSSVPLAFGTDVRLDTDAGLVNPEAGGPAAIAVDGASHVYHAFAANTFGPYPDLHVAASGDLGRTFGTAVRVGNTAAGARISRDPALRAFPDGRVYLLYVLDGPGDIAEIRFNRSSDFGATWGVADLVLGSVGHIPGSRYWINTSPQLAALADGTVYVAWSDGVNVLFRKSTDFGASFSATAGIDQDPTDVALFPALCAEGDRIIVTYAAFVPGNESQFNYYSVVSQNRATTWLSRFAVRNPAVLANVQYGSLACGPGGTASLVFGDDRSGTAQLFSSAFGGSSWTPEALVATPVGLDAHWPHATFTSGTVAVVAYENPRGEIHVSRSTNGGATYPAFMRLDDATPGPATPSSTARTVSDGAGNVWVRFLDGSSGATTPVARHSADSGLTWGTVRRPDRNFVAGSRVASNGPSWLAPDAAASGGIAYLGWAAEHRSALPEALFNAWDGDDLDRDGFLSGTDCSETDPISGQFAVEVAGVRIAKDPGGTLVSWTSQDVVAGVGTAYDVVKGSLSDLRSTGNFSAATCLVDNDADTPYLDAGADPAPGTGFYYLLRAENGCGIGTFGHGRDLNGIWAVCP